MTEGANLTGQWMLKYNRKLEEVRRDLQKAEVTIRNQEVEIEKLKRELAEERSRP